MKRVISLLFLAAGFVVCYFLWPQSVDLPKLGKVNEVPLTEVEGGEMLALKKPKLITFFYTKCPDICPMTMMDLKDLQQLLKEKGITDDQYLIYAVTLDPAYDTNERITQYRNTLEITSGNWLFFRGTEEETKKFTEPFNMFYKKDEGGFVTHSTTMYIVDSDRQIRSYHNMATGNKRVNIEEVADHLEQLINKGK